MREAERRTQDYHMLRAEQAREEDPDMAELYGKLIRLQGREANRLVGRGICGRLCICTLALAAFAALVYAAVVVYRAWPVYAGNCETTAAGECRQIVGRDWAQIYPAMFDGRHACAWMRQVFDEYGNCTDALEAPGTNGTCWYGGADQSCDSSGDLESRTAGSRALTILVVGFAAILACCGAHQYATRAQALRAKILPLG